MEYDNRWLPPLKLAMAMRQNIQMPQLTEIQEIALASPNSTNILCNCFRASGASDFS